MKRTIACVLLGLMTTLSADTLTYRDKKIDGLFLSFSKFRIFFQGWDGEKPEAYDPVRAKIKFDKPAKVTLKLSKSPKKQIQATLIKFAKTKFTFVIDGEEKIIHYRQISSIDVTIDMKEFIQRREEAHEAAGGPKKAFRVAELLEHGKATIVHFHIDEGPSSQRQGNLVHRLCEESRGKAVCKQVTLTGLDDPIAVKLKLATLPQFWFFTPKGAVSSRLTDRFTEEDISEAFKKAVKGK